MIYSYALSKEAAADIEDIFEFGEYEFGYDLAIKYLIGLEEHFEKLVKNPDNGRERNDIRKGLYSFPYISYIIFTANCMANCVSSESYMVDGFDKVLGIISKLGW